MGDYVGGFRVGPLLAHADLASKGLGPVTSKINTRPTLRPSSHESGQRYHGLLGYSEQPGVEAP
jgi:hypothetical protein